MTDDLIRRSDAIKAIKHISENYTGRGKRDYHPHIDFLVDALKYDVPTIEPKRGEWINVSGSWSPNKKCSVCGEVVHEYNYNFCPYCGADMREREGE